MSQVKTFIIGRHRECDLVLDDTSVSRHHAEVVPMPDGHYYITDRNSTGGTFVHSDSGWEQIRQRFVKGTDRLRLGGHEIDASRLGFLCTLPGRGDVADIGASNLQVASDFANPASDDGLDPNKGLMRDPVTGEVIEKS